MGLAASQARLLTITSRKSRAQFENMRFSHQKLALSRKLTDLSNEYQNALNQTKLYYDFYGVNSTDTPLTYNMLMSPSSINDYTPTLLTNNQGQVILSAPYAAAARAAGIPMEGLGCQPSSILREAFVLALAENGVITSGTAEAIIGVDYNQGAGLGSSNLVNTQSTYGDFQMLLDVLKSSGDAGTFLNNSLINQDHCKIAAAFIDGTSLNLYNDAGNGIASNTYDSATSTQRLDQVNMADLLNPTGSHVFLICESNDDGRFAKPIGDYEGMIKTVYNVIDQLATALGSRLEGSGDAIAYANMKMQSELGTSVTELNNKGNYFNNGAEMWAEWGGYWGQQREMMKEAVEQDIENIDIHGSADANSYLGLVNVHRRHVPVFTFGIGNRLEAVAALDLTDFTRAWFTYFMQYMLGLGSAQANNLNVAWGSHDDKSTFASIKELGEYKFTFTSTTVSDDEALISNFYDTLFNQICMNGWTENNQIDKDSNYLKEMLQNGMMYITSMSDDYYFYQNNYATNSFIKEVADDTAIAAAESKYTTEKARINAKEQEIDLKMKNLDTEISSLETEYEAVKKIIENNASKAFTRYDG